MCLKIRKNWGEKITQTPNLLCSSQWNLNSDSVTVTEQLHVPVIYVALNRLLGSQSKLNRHTNGSYFSYKAHDINGKFRYTSSSKSLTIRRTLVELGWTSYTKDERLPTVHVLYRLTAVLPNFLLKMTSKWRKFEFLKW